MNPTERMHLAHSMLEQAWAFRNDSDNVLPTWFIHDQEAGLQIVGTPFEEGRPKAAYADVVAQIVRQSHADFVLFVSDVWMRYAAPGDNTRPSQAHDAVEAIAVQSWHQDGTGFALYRLYRQTDDGTLEVLDNKAVMGDPETETFAAVVEALR